MPTTYIHIGTHKTGSTALQQFLQVNRRALKDYHFHHPDFGDFASHALAFGLGFGMWVPPNTTREQLLARARKELTTATARAIKAGNNAILSSEVFSAFSLKDIGIVSRFKAFLAECGLTNVRIICYCRRQDHFAESIYNERIKGGHPKELPAPGEIWNMDTYRLLGYYRDVFGADNIMVRPFEKNQFTGGDLFTDFLDLLGLSFRDDFQRPPEDTCNISFNRDITELLRLYGGGDFKDASCHLAQHVLVTHFSRDTLQRHKVDPPLLSPQQRIAFLEHYEASNQAVARDYLNRPDGKLYLEPWPDPDESWEPYAGLGADKLSPLLLDLLVRQHVRWLKAKKAMIAGGALLGMLLLLYLILLLT
jgi:hypothetical protein